MLNYKRLQGNQVVYLSAPRVECMMTGVHHAEQDKTGKITIVYEDGSTESVLLPDMQLSEQTSLIKVVGIIQGYRKSI